uniref:Plastid-encoded RNA polymerase subunit alpha n=1 Tax=Derbesia sp. WEST4838 TaxID=1847751 RepID=A0A1C9JBC9_9CHLO|nr:RNA polymerase a-subunit [Derbesia sp. WEST4838]AOP19151.1 RNA polymerase a-subunit [Derbesia sp. WEST4838]
MVNLSNNKIIFSCTQTQIERNIHDEIIKFYGCFQLGFFAKYEALTIANSIRRTVLTQSRQYAITAIKIENIKHEYSSIRGVKETIFDILKNLQKIILSSERKVFKTQILCVSESGPKQLKAKDLKFPTFLHCINPNQLILTLESSIQFRMIIFIDHISVYSSSLFTCHYYKNLYLYLTQFKRTHSLLSTDFLLLNPKTSPILNLNYTIHKKTNQSEMIIFDIWTDGSVHPAFLLRQAIQRLLVLLVPFYEFKKVIHFKYQKPILSKLFLSKFIKLDLCNFPIENNLYKKLLNLRVSTIGDLYKFLLKKDTVSFNQLTYADRFQIKQLLKLVHLYISRRYIKMDN